MLPASATHVEVAFAVCTALERSGETAVLCGGSAASYYVPDRYRSLDLDFVLRTGTAPHLVNRALAELGYERVSEGYYGHPALPFSVEFPVGPLAIGRDAVTTWRTDRRGDAQLHVLTPYDVVRDRFMHYWAWGDETAFRAAVAIARAHRDEIDLATFAAWTAAEMRADRSYTPDAAERLTRALQAQAP